MAEHSKNINKALNPVENGANSSDVSKKMCEKSLEQKAIDEILREIEMKAVRAEVAGPSGWREAPLKRTNKRFLGNTLKAVLTHNTRKADRQKFESKKKLLELDYDKHPSRRPKFGDRKILFQKPKKDEKKDSDDDDVIEIIEIL